LTQGLNFVGIVADNSTGNVIFYINANTNVQTDISLKNNMVSTPSTSIGIFPAMPNRYFSGNIYDIVFIGTNLNNSQVNNIREGRMLPSQFDCRLWNDYRLGHSFDLSEYGNNGVLNGFVRFV
jgi:hypothetical protein